MAKIVVGMSGGLDSSVAAGLLVQAGHQVIGITIKTYKYEDVGGMESSDTSCCSLDGINDARRVAQVLGIPHYVYDFTEVFQKEIIDYFIAGYLHGDTPNPCVMCNRKIKWAELIRRASALGADCIATGHYAGLRKDPATGRYVISRASDAGKDQSYALWAVAQESLAHTMFPLSGLTKTDSRALARQMNLPVAAKRESYEICFIPDNDYNRFLKDNVEGLQERVDGGDIVLDGKVIGRHKGYPFYTVGQRKGIGISAPEPLFVLNVLPESNTIEVGSGQELMHNALRAGQVNMVKYARLDTPRIFTVKIRYRDAGAPALCSTTADGLLEVRFQQPRRAITRGQSAVLYEGDDLVGGGIIQDVFDA